MKHAKKKLKLIAPPANAPVTQPVVQPVSTPVADGEPLLSDEQMQKIADYQFDIEDVMNRPDIDGESSESETLGKRKTYDASGTTSVATGTTGNEGLPKLKEKTTSSSATSLMRDIQHKLDGSAATAGSIKPGQGGNAQSPAKEIAASPSEFYTAKLIEVTEELGGPTQSYEEARHWLVTRALQSNLLHADLVGAISTVDSVVQRHRNTTVAAIATVLNLQENILLVDGGGAYEAVVRAATEESMEFQPLVAPPSTASDGVVAEHIALLARQLGWMPEGRTPPKGRVLVVSGLGGASASYREALVGAMVTRRIGSYPVPSWVRVAMIEASTVLPSLVTELAPHAFVLNVCSTQNGALDELLAATEARKTVIENQLRLAKAQGNQASVDVLEKLLAKSGYVGEQAQARTAAARTQSSGRQAPSYAAGKQTTQTTEQMLDQILGQTGQFSRHEKSAILTDVVGPEKSRFRRQVAGIMLGGLHGPTSAQATIDNYLRHNQGVFSDHPSVEDVVAGTSTVAEASAHIAGGDEAYITALALELQGSAVVEAAMRRGGADAMLVQQIFLALSDRDPVAAAGIARTRPYFVS